MFAGQSGIVSPASAHLQCRLATDPALQLAAMAKTAPTGKLGLMPVRCLIVDDNYDFLRVASDLPERDGISVVGVASTSAQAYHSCSELEPDVGPD
jgi:hypothetical protein